MLHTLFGLVVTVTNLVACLVLLGWSLGFVEIKLKEKR